MKKFKKSIEISTENISDVLQVPIVTSLYKAKNFKAPCLEGRSVPYDTIAVMYVHIEGFDSDFCIAKATFSLLIFVILGMLFRGMDGKNIKTMRYEEERILRIRPCYLSKEVVCRYWYEPRGR